MLAQRFGDEALFMDVDAIRPGRDFRKAIEESIEACAVLLTVIGPEWLTAANAAGERRLDESNDYVRLEIAAALRRDIAIIPLLIRGARMPQSHELPEEIADLAYRNGVQLTHARWKSDLQHLVQAIEPYMLPAEQPPSPAPSPSTPSPVIPSAFPAALPTERVAKLLAHYIGPIAEIVVKRAASRATSLQSLCAAVAEEIESPADRRAFLANFPH